MADHRAAHPGQARAGRAAAGLLRPRPQPGCRAASPGHDGCMRGSVEQLERIVHHLGWGHRSLVLGGCSMGAAAALRYADSHPERIHGLLLVAAAGAPEAPYNVCYGTARLFRLLPVWGKLTYLRETPRYGVEDRAFTRLGPWHITVVAGGFDYLHTPKRAFWAKVPTGPQGAAVPSRVDPTTRADVEGGGPPRALLGVVGRPHMGLHASRQPPPRGRPDVQLACVCEPRRGADCDVGAPPADRDARVPGADRAQLRVHPAPGALGPPRSSPAGPSSRSTS